MDAIYKEIGEHGRYQIVIYVLLIVSGSFPAGFIAFSQVFLSAVPNHWCLVPELVTLNVSTEARKNLSIPLVIKDGVLKHSQCEMYAINYTKLANVHRSNFNNWTFDIRVVDESLPRQKCIDGWEYDNSDYDATLVTTFDLVCDENWWPSFCTSVFYAGGMIGNVFFGFLSDRYGRKISFHINLFLIIVLPAASAFSSNYLIFTIFRFLIGLQFPAIYQQSFVIAMEMTSSKHRTTMGMLVALAFGFSIAVLSLIAYLTRNWFTLTLVTSVPFSLMIVYWWIIPESPRWLIAQNRLDEAEYCLQKIAKLNKKIVPRQILYKHHITKAVYEELSTTRQSTSPITLFRTPNLRKKALVLMMIFLTNSISYTGLTYMSANFGVSDYFAVAISGLVELPSCLLAWYAMERWGRRWMTLLTMISVGLCCIGNVFVHENTLFLNVLLPSLGKFFITCSFSIAYIYGGELMPTVVRGSGLGLSAFACGIGNIAMPYIVYLVEYSRVLPLLIMGCTSIAGGIGVIFLPETLDTELPDTLEDGEKFGSDMEYSSWLPKKVKKSRETTNLNSEKMETKS